MKKYLLSILCGILLLPGCNYLDMVPEKDIETVESLFEQRTKVEPILGLIRLILERMNL